MNSASIRMAALFIIAVALTMPTNSASADDPWTEKALLGHVPTVEGKLNTKELDKLRAQGEHLFTAKFTKLDGAGRPFASHSILPTKLKHKSRQMFQRIAGLDANACSSCHNDPVAGGAGHITANVFVSEGFTNSQFNTTDPQFSNERNTNHLMGAGLIELLAREMTTDLLVIRDNALRKSRKIKQPVEANLKSKGVSFGMLEAHPDGLVNFDQVEGVDNDLNIRPFSQKGVFTSLRQFTVNAMNHHHGMQAVERFGPRWTGEDDFDGDKMTNEITLGDISALVAWQAGLGPPGRIIPKNSAWQKASKGGEKLFGDIGCANCHIPALPLNSLIFSDPGNFDAAGTLRLSDTIRGASYDLALMDWAKTLPKNDKGQVLVPLFGDLKRHKISDPQVAILGNELLAQRFVGRDVFQTSELWGIGSTAPYGHRGELVTLDEVIRAHGGEARKSRDAYVKMESQSRSHLIAFLKTLVIKP